MRKKILGFTMLVLVFISLIIFWKIKVIEYNDNIYIEWSDSGAFKRVENLISDEKIKVTSSLDDNINDVLISDLGINFKLVNSDNQEINKIPRFLDLNQVLLYYIEDGQVFKKYFSRENEKLSSSSNAYYEITDSDIILHKEVKGTKFDVNKLFDDYSKSLDRGIIGIDLNSYIVEPEITTEYFSKTEEKLNKLRGWGISYSNGFYLTFKDLVKYIKIKDKYVSIRTKKLTDYLVGYLPDKISSYNTVGKSRKFKTTLGGKVVLSSGTYGDVVDLESEVKYIIDSLNKCEFEDNRKPILSIDLPNKLPSTYIEVSISKQHLWYYVDGKLKMETDIVTGTRGRTDTPRGIYYISEKIAGKYLTGDTYKTWVNQWMRLTNTGIGLHDAYWRGNFGGSIYTYSGSHGCVNLPKDFAKRLFNSVDWKTVVIIY